MTPAVLRPGEVVLRDATRSFSVRADNARTLKGVLIGRRAQGPAPIPALRGVNLSIAPGETVGIVGRNGAGKTSTLKVLAGIVPLQAGFAAAGGRVVSLLELASGFARDFSGRENILLQGALYGLRRVEMEARMEQIIAFSELGDFIDVPVKTYSSGMFVRLGFSIAAHLEADVLLIDEVLAVGDEAFQRKCLRRISEQIAGGATLVLVSHDPGSIERVCERVVVLDAGRVVFDGPTAEGLLHYHRLMGTEHGAGTSLRPDRADPLKVTQVELRDEAGRTASVFPSGSALHVIVGVQLLAGAGDRSLRLELRDQAGALVLESETPVLSESMAFEIPELALAGGDYDISLGPGGGALQRTVRFSIPREPIRGGSWRAAVELPR
jgi:ABC-type polysaccharide/polyol phosphate transport system ATPase subunit